MNLMERMESDSTYEPNTGCRLWLGSQVRGHGRIKIDGKVRELHRVAWELAHGPIPADKWVLHKCGIGICFNVDHLKLGNQLQNARDRMQHGGYVGRPGEGRLVKYAPDYGRVNRGAIAMAKPIDINQTALRAALDYDQETGVLRWRERADRNRNWNAKYAHEEAGAVLTNGYRYLNIMNKLYLAHRLIWVWMTGEQLPPQIDHVNGKRADNRWTNLRAATQTQNSANQGLRSTNKSGVKGVSWDVKHNAWRAGITVKGKQMFLGHFASVEEAAECRRAAELEHQGSFARVVGNA